MKSHTVRVRAVLLGATALAVMLPSVRGRAQSASGAMVPVHETRWQPWLGCWTPTGASPMQTIGAESLGSAARTMLCIVPGATPTSVDIVNFVGGAIVERTVVDPGRVIAKSVDDCSGTESATWSADGRRLLMRGTFTCARGVKRLESGLMSIDADGQWVQSQSVAVNGKASTFVAKFRDTGIAIEGIADGALVERPLLDAAGKRLSPPRDGCVGTESVSPVGESRRVTVKSDYTCAGALRRVADASFIRSSDGRWVREGGSAIPFSTPSARADAGAPVSTDDVLEVAKAVDASVTEAWLTDRQQQFPLTGKELVRLADGGLPPRVLDMMVAVSNPRSFTIRRPGEAQGGDEPMSRTDARRGVSDVDGRCVYASDYCYGMMGLGWLYGADRYYGWDPYGYRNGLGFNRFGFNNGFGFGGGGFYGPGYFYGNGPIVIVNPNNTPAEPRGRLVYGQGYTRDRGTSASEPRASDYSRSSGGGASSSGSGSSGAGSSGSSSGGSSGGDGGARTAKPRGSGGL